MIPLQMKRVALGFEFILKNFAAPIAFFLVFHAYGGKAAISVAIALSVFQLFLQLALKQAISPFFITASGFTVLFGGLDLLAHEPRYFKLAPAAESFSMGTIFAVSVLIGKPIVVWFVRAIPAAFRPSTTENMADYLRKLTVVWSVYFFLKSLVFLYIAFQVDLGQLIVLRSIIGGASLAMMFGGELLYRKKFSPRFRRAERGGSV